MANAEIEPLRFATYKNLPLGSTAVPVGSTAPGNGDPGTGVRRPVVLLTANADTLPVPVFAAKTNLPSGSVVMPAGPGRAAPDANGEPATGVSSPVTALILNAPIVFAV